MKTLFLIDGSGGTGKSGLLRYVDSERENATFIPKYTTREIRSVEKCRESSLDIRIPTDTRNQFMERTHNPSFYRYEFGENKQGKEYYGFYKNELNDALTGYDIVLIIVRNLRVIQRVKEVFPEIQCISVFLDADRDVIPND